MNDFILRTIVFKRFSIIVGLFVIWGYLFLQNGGDYLPECAFFYFTGLYCPGCGAGRALVALSQGCIWDAFWLNPLLFVWIAIFGYYIFFKFFNKSAIFFTHQRIQAVFWILIGYWILRNLPFYPFLMLVPK